MISAVLGNAVLAALTLPYQWTPTGHAVSPTATISFTLSVRQQHAKQLQATALAVSTPGNARYGKFLTESQIRSLTAPLPSDMQVVTSWLDDSNMTYTVRNELVTAVTTVSKAEPALRTTFYELTHPDHGQKLICDVITLPDAVRRAIASIHGLQGLPLPKRKLVRTATTANVTPGVIASTYFIQGVDVKRGSNNTQAVAEFQGQRMNKTDLSDFFSNVVPASRPGDEIVSKFVGEDYTEGEGVEALLDVEYIMGVSPGVATEFWGFQQMDFCADLVDFTDQLLSSDLRVMSVSYGWQGDLNMIGCPSASVQTIDLNFAKLAAKGVSVIFSSGDSGSGYTEDDVCQLPVASGKKIHGDVLDSYPQVNSQAFCCSTFKESVREGAVAYQYNRGTKLCTIFKSVQRTSHDANSVSYGAGVTPPAPAKLYASWPASSPWVTAVGATRFINDAAGNPEMASDQFGSGGGFSSLFNQSDAPWQKAAVAKYVAQGSSLPKFPASSYFDANGRATPDISALGEGYQVYTSKGVISVGGTSASAPAFAAMVSLINDALLQVGKPALGFLNPFLYQNANAFTDVTAGTNAIGRGSGPVPVGYAAAPGWDAATGLGTPIFSKLLSAALA